MRIRWDDYTLKEKVEILRYEAQLIDYGMPTLVLILALLADVIVIIWFGTFFYLFCIMWNLAWAHKKYQYKKIVKARLGL